MQNDPDYQMALLLQQQFNLECNTENQSPGLIYSEKKKKPITNKASLIDPSWELVDPTPNIFALFVQFSDKFFWNKLGSVSVSWSKRMTSCAGICSYQGRGGMCRITLSEPLLKLRPRKDLIETLLHEMIHAFLFVTHNNRDRDGHGPEFHKHMYRINGEAGTKITVYHNFHDEVRLYKQHWWRCNGECQKRPPFFGMVRRAMNRAPGPNDRWWAQHQQTCGGSFIKVKEPEKNNKQSESNKNNKINKPSSSTNFKSPNSPDIRTYLPVLKDSKENIHTVNTPGTKNKNSNYTPGTKKGVGTKNKDSKENIHTINTVGAKGGLGTKNKNGTVVLNPKNSNKISDPSVGTVISGSNIVGFSKDADKNLDRKVIPVFSGTGKKLSDSSSPGSTPDYNKIRNHWANKFPSNNNIYGSNSKRKSLDFDSEINKKPKNSTQIANSSKVQTPNSSIFSRADICSNNKNKSEVESPNLDSRIISKNTTQDLVSCPNCNKLFSEIELNTHLDSCLSADISIKSEFSNESLVMVECPICKIMVEEDDLNNHLDDCLEKNSGDKNSPLKNNASDEKECELCNAYIPSSDYTLHIHDCLNKMYDNIEENLDVNPTSDAVMCLVCNKSIVKDLLDDHLEDCMGSAFNEDKFEENDEDSEDDCEIVPLDKTVYNCPICMEVIDENNMNSHIDECLNQDVIKNEFC